MVTFDRGYLVLGKKVPFRFHWSLPLGAFLLGSFQVRPWFWLAFVFLVLAHELGHAFFVWRFKMRVTAIDVSGIGGLCHYAGHPTRIESATIAWGGVLAQAAILFVTLLVGLVAGPPTAEWSAELYSAFTRWNLMIIGINLIPFPPLDGAKAWPLFGMLAQARSQERHSWDQKRKNVAARARDDRDGQVIDFEWARSKREKKAVDSVDDQIREIVERAHRDHSKKKEPPTTH